MWKQQMRQSHTHSKRKYNGVSSVDALTFRPFDWHTMYKHQVAVGNLAHETCRFKKRLRNTKGRNIDWVNHHCYSSECRLALMQKCHSLLVQYLCDFGLGSWGPLRSLRGRQSCCWTRHPHHCLPLLAPADVLSKCSFWSHDPSAVPVHKHHTHWSIIELRTKHF